MKNITQSARTDARDDHNPLGVVTALARIEKKKRAKKGVWTNQQTESAQRPPRPQCCT